MLLQHRLARVSDAEAEAVIVKHQAELQEAMDALIVAAVADFKNITENGQNLKCTADAALKYFGFGAAFYQQVQSAITDQHRLFTAAASA